MLVSRGGDQPPLFNGASLPAHPRSGRRDSRAVAPLFQEVEHGPLARLPHDLVRGVPGLRRAIREKRLIEGSDQLPGAVRKTHLGSWKKGPQVVHKGNLRAKYRRASAHRGARACALTHLWGASLSPRECVTMTHLAFMGV